ncbi:DNA polymerase III subunit beta [Meiothermus sp. Pnk-1]|uniref:DNA polymerase III subunit beta n=1 Tax=Meiothermus sp. Pnk-1 TaxID=873128 RepID=UPI000D7BE406|nr:DNA polymerase III subunit beta [Meiothermus sp. Pnk-1]PZA08270.1 DNA polymerase III subunit beta [Meiothermus sp. Pnk-1]
MIRVSRKALVEAVGLVGSIIPKGNKVNPLLGNLFVQASPAGMRLWGSNGEIDLEVSLEAEVEREYRALVPYAPFHAFLAALRGDTVSFKESGRLELESEAARASFATMSPEEYPALFEGWVEPQMTLTNAELLFILKAAYAASTEEYRGIFRGVQLESGGGKLKAVASDGYRLAMAWVEHSEQAGVCVIPRAVVGILQQLAEPGERGALGWNERGIFYRSGPYRLSARRLEGEMPDYNRVIPQAFVAKLSLPREAFLESVRRVAVLADPDNRRLDLHLDDKITLGAEGDWGRSSEVMQGEYQGPTLAFSVRAPYLLDALKYAADAEIVTLDLSGPTTPFVVRGERTMALIVPLRV